MKALNQLAKKIFTEKFPNFFKKTLVVLPAPIPGVKTKMLSDERIKYVEVMTASEFYDYHDKGNVFINNEGDFSYDIFGNLVVRLEELMTKKDVWSYCLKLAAQELKKS